VAVTTYAIGLGSNRRGRAGAPERVLARALAELNPRAVSPILRSAPLGPSSRRFANAVALVDSAEAPPVMLARLKALERAAGRRRGRRWGARVLDLDLLLWSGGAWTSASLIVPHPAFRERHFVLDPLASLVPGWRDPQTGRTVRQLRAALRRSRPVDRRAPAA
jgi:2-amino-4-hydroxy-6-hydroxymethyldihydropteridine diphosphokinase